MGRELVSRSTPTEPLDLREVAARITLESVRHKGHAYVELRRAGKRSIFFCTLCLTSCYSDDVLFEHLGGNLHAKRYAAAKATLFGPDPWPFSDGVLFFGGGGEVKMSDCCRRIQIGGDEHLSVGVIGTGHVGTRVEHQTDGRLSRIGRIWCAWLGQADSSDSEGLMATPKCDFAVVTFKYSYDLGRHRSLDDMGSPRSEGSCCEANGDDGSGKKRKKSFSDPEDSCDSGQGGLQLSRFSSSKSCRRELRRRKRLAAEKTCDICAQEMIPGRDVGTLLNCKTGNLACSSRNTNRAFHLFHVSCLVHWILLCEFELRTDQLGYVKCRGRKKKDAVNKPLTSVFCPECQGTGKHIVGDELEKPTIPLSEVFLYKLKALEAHKAWMKDPEVLEKCSTGLHFPSKSDLVCEQKVVPVKLLRFYGVDG